MDKLQTMPLWKPVLYGALGAASYGIFDVLRVVMGGRLHPGPVSVFVLLVATIAATGLLGGGSMGVAGLIPAVRRWSHRTWPFLGGLAVVMAGAFAERWFSDPPPFQEPFPLQGNPLVFLLLGFALPAALVWGLSKAVERGGTPARGGLAGALLLGGIGMVVLGQEGPSNHTPVDPTAPNLLLVTLDTTRSDRFGKYPIDTAAYDRIAAEGARFDLAMAQIPVTGPSHASMLSGRPPWENNMLLNGEPVSTDIPWLPQLLADRGYQNGAFVSAWVLMRNLGFDRGFHVFDDDFSWIKGIGLSLPGRLYEMVQRRRQGVAYLLERTGDRTTDDALRWLEGQGEGPWMAWVHLFDAHGPYEPPPPYDQRYYKGTDPRDPSNTSMEQIGHVQPYMNESLAGITDTDWVVAQYDGEVAYADDQLERLLDALDDAGIADNTMVIVTGDHGEGLGEQGEWFDHGDWLYEHDLHVPLAIRFPGRIAPGTVVTHPVELSDLAPTIVDYFGIEMEGTTGTSLRAAMEQGAIPHPLARAMAFDREPNRAARKADPTFKPTWRQGALRGPRDHFLYRDAEGYASHYFRCDIEACDLSDEIDVRVADMLENAARDLLSAKLGARPEKSASEQEMLEALGYTEPTE